MSRVILEAPRTCYRCGRTLAVGESAFAEKSNNGYIFRHSLHDAKCNEIAKRIEKRLRAIC